MKKEFKTDELPYELKNLIEQFVEAKKSVYGYDEVVLAEKEKKLYKNIKSIIVTNKLTGHIKGHYNFKSKKLTVAETTWFNGMDKQTFMHELNHAWNANKEKFNIIPRNWSNKKKRKYNALNEIINEAETQILIDKDVKADERKSRLAGVAAANFVGNSTTSAQSSLGEEGRFHCYSDVECLFDTLVTVTNITPIEFLRMIEGKDVEGIADVMAQKTGHTKERMLEYLDVIAENTSVNKNNKDKKLSERFQEIYDESTRIIDESNLDENVKRENKERLACTQDRLILTSGIYQSYIEPEKEDAKSKKFTVPSKEDKEKLEKIKDDLKTGERSGATTFLTRAREIIKHPEYSKKYSPFVKPDWGDKDIKKIDLAKSGRILLLDHSVDDRSIFRKIIDRMKSRNVPKIAVAPKLELKQLSAVPAQMDKLEQVNNQEEIENYYIESQETLVVENPDLNKSKTNVEEIF